MNHTCLPIYLSDDRDEWMCPFCGYHFIFSSNEMQVLNGGDMSVVHYGSSGGLRISFVDIHQEEQ